VSSHAKRFIPAAGHDLLLPLYDPLLRLTGADRTRRRLIEAAAIRPGDRVLEIGCGTGTLAVMLKQRHPESRVSGLDPDPRALARARAKAERAGVEIAFEQAFAGELPWPEGSFERVLSSLMLHHLERSEKEAALSEARRVLAPGGTLHVLDFGPPGGRLDRALTRLVHRGERLADNVSGLLPELMRGAGFAGAREVERLRTLFGSLSLYEAQR
jgi:ubiquinone/menaquinone biosynthesis C-methylase UbiE